MPCFSVLLRILVIISFLCYLVANAAFGQIACPAMGLTQVNVNKKGRLAGFSSAVRNNRKGTRMGDFFSSKKRSSSGFSDKDPFSSKSSRKKLFRDFDEFSSRRSGRGSFYDKDEFASRNKRKGRFRSYDEFAMRSKRSRQFRDFDEFAYRRRTKRVNIDSQFAVRSTEKRFRKRRDHKDEFRSKKKRSKEARSEYTPFASTTTPFAGEKRHREPQLGLWGGSVGKRSGKDNRPATPLPEPEKKKDD